MANAFAMLRDAARGRGLPGVYVVGGFGVWRGSAGDDDRFTDNSWVPGDGYDALTQYGYAEAPPDVPGEQPFAILADAGRWIWRQMAQKSPLPFVPIAMDGWDPRPIRPVDLAARSSDVVSPHSAGGRRARGRRDQLGRIEPARPARGRPRSSHRGHRGLERAGRGQLSGPDGRGREAYGTALASVLARDR